MSKFQVTKGIINNLNNASYAEGKIYFVYDDINSENLDIYADIDGVRRKIDTIKIGGKAGGIPYGHVDSTSTAKAFTATVEGLDSLYDGACVMLRNGVITSASGWTLNVNNLGALPVYSNMGAQTRETTLFSTNYTMLFVYDSDRVEGGCWVLYRGYYSDADKMAYQVRTNNTVRNVSDTARYYKIYFTSADGTMWVPASANSTNNASAARPVNQRPIDPFGPIVYTSANTSYAAGDNLAAGTMWQQYNLTLGYSFNRTGAALALTSERPVYVKCAPQADGSAIMDANEPIVQSLPASKDGKIYIYLGLANSATAMELQVWHPVYWHDGTGIRIWTGVESSGGDISMTEEEVDAAVEAAWPAAPEYAISAVEGDIEHGNLRGIGLDDTVESGSFIETAPAGATVYVLTQSMAWKAKVTDASGASVSSDFYGPGDVGFLYTFVMPSDAVSVSLIYDD